MHRTVLSPNYLYIRENPELYHWRKKITSFRDINGTQLLTQVSIFPQNQMNIFLPDDHSYFLYNRPILSNQRHKLQDHNLEEEGEEHMVVVGQVCMGEGPED